MDSDIFLLLKKNMLSDRGDEEGVNDRETPEQEDFTMTGRTHSLALEYRELSLTSNISAIT